MVTEARVDERCSTDMLMCPYWIKTNTCSQAQRSQDVSVQRGKQPSPHPLLSPTQSPGAQRGQVLCLESHSTWVAKVKHLLPSMNSSSPSFSSTQSPGHEQRVIREGRGGEGKGGKGSNHISSEE